VELAGCVAYQRAPFGQRERNIVANAEVGPLYFIPGIDETLRRPGMAN
jgi:hypothetical protein